MIHVYLSTEQNHLILYTVFDAKMCVCLRLKPCLHLQI